MRALVCGDRHWSDETMIRWVLTRLVLGAGLKTVVQGGAAGADSMAAKLATDLGLACETFHAGWAKHGKAAGPIRNRQMLDTKPDLVLAFHDDLEHSRGTKDCVTEARRRGIEVRVLGHTP